MIPTVAKNPAETAAWSTRRELGSAGGLRSAVWLARHLGRPLTRLLILPICLGFVLCHPAARAASRGYLNRALGRPARLWDIARHFFTFGTTVLDRVYLLNDEIDRFDITIHGEEIVSDILARGQGCLLLGAHHGSFEVLRLIGRNRPDLRVSLAMYEETGRKIGAALNAINPHLAPHIIGLGTPGAMIQIKDCLERGGFVGVLADRTLQTDTPERMPFLGAPAPFPTGPQRLAALLRPQVVLMVGLFRGGNRYEIHFERLAASEADRPEASEIARVMDRFVERLECYCRVAPYNWFNFFDFWA
ncbi:MAG TPA: hypothetical protein VHB27_13935 [Rhodopila sp.]|uniref:LpxL/LpxP family acyltransferase n=1 Tax=Rhodopila sp. TaxID=2480087 RepID=UPI002BDA6C4A|nr:hypothetical protein [Rhodopila sp.]HVY16321.1 hypothetical protein [Rhodopila sp.]